LTKFYKYPVFFLFSLLATGIPQLLSAQNLKDTLHLPEFEIKSNFVIDNQGFKRTKLDSIILAPRMNADLSTVLTQHSTIFIKSYGNGTLATSSFRGTAAQHTQVEWNGINLNSPMLGQIDFSQIRVSQFDGLEILYGSAGISRTSGAFGGVIDLVTSPDWNNRFDAMAAQTIASFDNYTTNINLAMGNRMIQSHTKFNYTSSLNDFTFANDTGKVLRQKNSSYKHFDLSQEFFCKIRDKHLLSAKIWYNNDDRNLPATITNSDPDHHETQEDNALRAILEYKYVEKNYNLLVRSALVDQYMHYVQAGVVDASYRCYSSINRLRFSYNGVRNLTIKPGLDFNYDWVFAKSYNGLKTRSTTSLFAEIGYTIGKHISTSLILREDLIDGKFIPIVPAFGIDYKPFSKINLAVTANLARNCRYPTLNDMFWEFYGNPDIKTETNYSCEIGSTWNSGKSFRKFFIEASLSGYYSLISDMITWLPDTTTNLYRPKNVPEVLARGVEFGLNLKWEVLRFNLGIVANYNFCRSTYEKVDLASDSVKLGKQLMYIPVNTLNATISLERWKFYCNYNFYYVSDRYTGNDNLTYMPAYYISNIIFGKNINLRNFILSLQLEINNLMDLDYQSISNRPMPGINYAFTMKLALPRMKGQ
jgi:outer membrane cobalamin receptor